MELKRCSGCCLSFNFNALCLIMIAILLCSTERTLLQRNPVSIHERAMIEESLITVKLEQSIYMN